jgi:L-threonylcarbamoyladenylate synthase
MAATSANRFGRISPTTAEAVREELGDRISAIVDGGPCAVGVESTIVAPGPKGWRLLRPGGAPLEELERVLGAKLLRDTDAAAPEAPGQLESHYAPRKPLRLLPKAFNALSDAELGALVHGQTRVGLLLISGDVVTASKRAQKLGLAAEAIALTKTGDLTEAATNLFAAMRKLDRSDATLLLAEPPATDHGLGYAIGDRLRRASAEKGKTP